MTRILLIVSILFATIQVAYGQLASSVVVENRRSARVGRNAPITWSPARAWAKGGHREGRL